MKTNPATIIKADDQMFGNQLSTTIGDDVDHCLGRPLVSHGVFGLLDVDNKVHILMEDDGHYWSQVITTQDVCDRLLAALKSWTPRYGKKSKKLLNGNDIRTPDFAITFDERDCVGIDVLSNEMGADRFGGRRLLVFSPYWLPALIATLERVKRLT